VAWYGPCLICGKKTGKAFSFSRQPVKKVAERRLLWYNRGGDEKMLEKGFDLRGTVEILNIEERIPKDHLLRKIDSAVDFSHIYDIVGDLYSADKGRKSVDPVVLFKIVLIQHLYGIPSLRQTIREIDMNMAYRWFLGYNFSEEIPHFATVSYAFARRYDSKIVEKVFQWILYEAERAGYHLI